MSLPPVRMAVPEDEDGLMQLGHMMHEEVGTFSIDTDKVRQMFRRSWNPIGDTVMTGVIGPIGEPYAVMGLVLGETWYSRDQFLGDFMVFVHPDHRRSPCARSLLKFGKKAADNLDVPLTIGVFGSETGNLFQVAMNNNLGNKTKAALSEKANVWRSRLNFYRSEYGEPVGFTFIYNRKWKADAMTDQRAA